MVNTGQILDNGGVVWDLAQSLLLIIANNPTKKK
jgi:hypothetical protein